MRGKLLYCRPSALLLRHPPATSMARQGWPLMASSPTSLHCKTDKTAPNSFAWTFQVGYAGCI